MNLIKRKSSRYILLIVAFLIIGVVGYTLYSMVADTNSTIGKTENGYRVDKDPITSRFPNVGQFDKCYWKADTIGKSGVGPSSYWMKGFVVLKREDFEAFKTQYKWLDVESGWKPSLDTSILNIQSFKWSFSTEFDNYIKSASYVGKFYLDLENGIVFFDVQK
ncbi:hypothetical protein CLHUN_17590 [Ruminiclostridium hungatei]|uniref:Uncharacterized protein n=1 Tax=Ruminiclostridium hungatei TaxID=48256 RepID=A0A1V4SKT0_RUMHU|nr:hypothetical protein [Ruminiclostridium hungatei]OPX44460.1 hypothetical protein CLHUN_17590 [Ruminiclostridium hungatei]